MFGFDWPHWIKGTNPSDMDQFFIIFRSLGLTIFAISHVKTRYLHLSHMWLTQHIPEPKSGPVHEPWDTSGPRTTGQCRDCWKLAQIRPKRVCYLDRLLTSGALTAALTPLLCLCAGWRCSRRQTSALTLCSQWHREAWTCTKWVSISTLRPTVSFRKTSMICGTFPQNTDQRLLINKTWHRITFPAIEAVPLLTTWGQVELKLY